MVRGLHSRVIVFIGVSPVLGSKRNPLDFITRKRMIEGMYPDITCLPLMDTLSDGEWSENLDQRIGEVAQYGDVTLYGGRDSFVPSYHGRFKPVELPLQVKNTSGEQVRAALSNQVIASADFRAGVIYSASNQWPRTVQCVDIAIFGNHGDILMGKKKGEVLWRFIGGHVDPTDNSLEEAAVREAREETSLYLDAADLTYVTSTKIANNWKYKKEQDKLFTSLFYGHVRDGQSAVPNDDIAEVRWLDFRELTLDEINLEHKELFKKLQERYE